MGGVFGGRYHDEPFPSRPRVRQADAFLGELSPVREVRKRNNKMSSRESVGGLRCPSAGRRRARLCMLPAHVICFCEPEHPHLRQAIHHHRAGLVCSPERRRHEEGKAGWQSSQASQGTFVLYSLLLLPRGDPAPTERVLLDGCCRHVMGVGGPTTHAFGKRGPTFPGFV